jgi:predicted site-specific integrase-resolvase
MFMPQSGAVLSPSGSNGDITDKRGIAAEWSVSLSTVDHWVTTRRIPVIRLSNRCLRFRRSAVREVLERGRVEEVA